MLEGTYSASNGQRDHVECTKLWASGPRKRNSNNEARGLLSAAETYFYEILKHRSRNRQQLDP
jgi:hypothetical protein